MNFCVSAAEFSVLHESNFLAIRLTLRCHFQLEAKAFLIQLKPFSSRFESWLVISFVCFLSLKLFISSVAETNRKSVCRAKLNSIPLWDGFCDIFQFHQGLWDVTHDMTRARVKFSRWNRWTGKWVRARSVKVWFVVAGSVNFYRAFGTARWDKTFVWLRKQTRKVQRVLATTYMNSQRSNLTSFFLCAYSHETFPAFAYHKKFRLTIICYFWLFSFIPSSIPTTYRNERKKIVPGRFVWRIIYGSRKFLQHLN